MTLAILAAVAIVFFGIGYALCAVLTAARVEDLETENFETGRHALQLGNELANYRRDERKRKETSLANLAKANAAKRKA